MECPNCSSLLRVGEAKQMKEKEMYLEIPSGVFVLQGVHNEDEIEFELQDGDLYTYFDKKFKLRKRGKYARKFQNGDLMREFIRWFQIRSEETKVFFKIEKHGNIYKVWKKYTIILEKKED